MSGFFASLMGNTLGKLGERLVDVEKRRALLRSVWRGCRFLLRFSVAAYVLVLVVLWLVFRYYGENNLTLAFLLYLPPVIWVLPLAPLLGLAVLMDWKLLFWGGVCGAVVMVGLLGWSFNRGGLEADVAGERTLKVFSFNRGQSGGATQRPFIQLTKPDILVFQDAPSRASQIVNAPGYEEFKHGDGVGEFTLVGKYPVLSKGLIESQGRAVAARFTVDWEGTTVAVYAVHLVSPRDALLAMRRGAFLWGVLGVPGTKWAEKRRSYEEFWRGQIAAAEAVLKSCREDKLPFVVAGDFNAPSQGYIQHLLRSELTDSHEVSGWGGGYTFPGKTGNPLAFGSPWLRIDKILCSEHWAVKWSTVEAEQPSQHRALAAALVLKRGS